MSHTFPKMCLRASPSWLLPWHHLQVQSSVQLRGRFVSTHFSVSYQLSRKETRVSQRYAHSFPPPNTPNPMDMLHDIMVGQMNSVHLWYVSIESILFPLTTKEANIALGIIRHYFFSCQLVVLKLWVPSAEVITVVDDYLTSSTTWCYNGLFQLLSLCDGSPDLPNHIDAGWNVKQELR